MDQGQCIFRRQMATLVALALVPLGCEGPTAPQQSHALDLQTASTLAARRPMKMVGTVAAVGEVIPPPAGCVLSFTTRIRLQATHMGAVEGDGATCVVSLTPDPSPPFLPPGPPPYGTAPFTASWVLRAANGDELRMEGFESVAVLGLESGSLRARGRFHVVGGTGRFEGATGELEAASVNFFGQPADEFKSWGWIDY